MVIKKEKFILVSRPFSYYDIGKGEKGRDTTIAKKNKPAKLFGCIILD